MNTSVILIAYHGDAWIPACVETLAAASTQRLHLVLVDNSGNTAIDGLDLRAFDAEVLRTPRPMGFAEANNYALVHAGHLEATVLFLNQDTRSPAGWMDRCRAAFGEDARLGAVSPLIRTYDETDWDPSFLACVPPSDRDALRKAEGVLYVRNAPAPALLVRTDVLRQTGPFDPVFGSYYEDYDLCRRIRAAGYRIGFCRASRIAHFSGSATDTPARERKRMRQILRNRVIYGLREASAPRGVALLRHLVLDLPRRLARGLVGTSSSQPVPVILQAYASLLGLGRRLVSRRADEAAWQQYLEALGWSRRTREAAGNNQYA